MMSFHILLSNHRRLFTQIEETKNVGTQELGEEVILVSPQAGESSLNKLMPPIDQTTTLNQSVKYAVMLAILL